MSGVWDKRLCIEVFRLVTSEFILYRREIGVPPMKIKWQSLLLLINRSICLEMRGCVLFELRLLSARPLPPSDRGTVVTDHQLTLHKYINTKIEPAPSWP